MNQYTKVYLSKLAEDLLPLNTGAASQPAAGFSYKPKPINYLPEQKPITKPITVKSPDGPVTFKPYTKEKSENTDVNFRGDIQPGIYMARAYGDQLYPELAKAEAYNKEHWLPAGPTAYNIEKIRPIVWDHAFDEDGGMTRVDSKILGSPLKGLVAIGTNPAPKALQDQALDTASNKDPYRINEDSTINHEGMHLLYDNPIMNGFAHKGGNGDNQKFERAFSDVENKMTIPRLYPLNHDSETEEQKVYLSQIQQNQFQQTGSRFDSKQWGDTVDKIFPEKQQVSNRDFEQSISQFPADSRRMFREMRKVKETNPEQFDVIKNWQIEHMPGITQNSPMTIGSRNVS